MVAGSRLDTEDRNSLWVMVVGGAVVLALYASISSSWPEDAHVQADAQAKHDCREQAERLRPKKPYPEHTSGDVDIADERYQHQLQADVCAARVDAARARELGSGGQGRWPAIALAAVASLLVGIGGLIFTSRTARGSRVIERAYLQARLARSTDVEGKAGHVLRVRNVGKTVARTLNCRVAFVEPWPKLAAISPHFEGRSRRFERVIGAGEQVKLELDVPRILPGSWVLILVGYEDAFGKPNQAWFCFSCSPSGKYAVEQDGYRCGGVGD